MSSTLLTTLALLLIIIPNTFSSELIVTHPADLKQQMKKSGKTKISPLGYKPKSGQMHGKVQLASPENACVALQKIPQTQLQNIFLLADDKSCLESVKVQNLADAGAFVGVIKRNINNTLHDRQINLVHIPILELDSETYDKVANYAKQNPNTTISMIANFSKELGQRIQIDFWITPNQIQSYKFILQMKEFILNQPRDILFEPRFVFGSQTKRKSYPGCFSNGRYCPAEVQFDGKMQGTKIVAQSLRQIIIAQKSVSDWFKYALNFYSKCLKNQKDLWVNDTSTICSENAMVMSGIDPKVIKSEYIASFQGSQIPQIDQNIILQEQRQLFIEEQIKKYPALLINKNQYTKLDPTFIKNQICYKIHPDPSKQTQQCQKLTNPSTFSYAQIFIGLGIFIVVMVLIMIGYRIFVHFTMKKQMKGQVENTLHQYYKYMETFEEDDPSLPKPLVRAEEKKIETNQIGSVELTEVRKDD